MSAAGLTIFISVRGQSDKHIARTQGLTASCTMDNYHAALAVAEKAFAKLTGRKIDGAQISMSPKPDFSKYPYTHIDENNYQATLVDALKRPSRSWKGRRGK